MGCTGEDPEPLPDRNRGAGVLDNDLPEPADGGRGEDLGCATCPPHFGHRSRQACSISDEAVISGNPTQAGTYDFYPRGYGIRRTRAASKNLVARPVPDQHQPRAGQADDRARGDDTRHGRRAVLVADDRDRARREDVDGELRHASAWPRARREYRPDIRNADGRRSVRLPGAREDEQRHADRHQEPGDRRPRPGRDRRIGSLHGAPAARRARCRRRSRPCSSPRVARARTRGRSRAAPSRPA